MLVLEILSHETEPGLVAIEIEEALGRYNVDLEAVFCNLTEPLCNGGVIELTDYLSNTNSTVPIWLLRNSVQSECIRRLLYSIKLFKFDLSVLSAADGPSDEERLEDREFVNHTLGILKYASISHCAAKDFDLARTAELAQASSYPRLAMSVTKLLKEFSRLTSSWSFLDASEERASPRRLTGGSMSEEGLDFARYLIKFGDDASTDLSCFPDSKKPEVLGDFNRLYVRCRSQLAAQSAISNNDWALLFILFGAVMFRSGIHSSHSEKYVIALLLYTRALELCLLATLLKRRVFSISKGGIFTADDSKAPNGCGSLVTTVREARVFYDRDVTSETMEHWAERCYQFLACRNNLRLTHGFVAPSKATISELFSECKDLIEELLGYNSFQLFWRMTQDLAPASPKRELQVGFEHFCAPFFDVVCSP